MHTWPNLDTTHFGYNRQYFGQSHSNEVYCMLFDDRRDGCRFYAAILQLRVEPMGRDTHSARPTVYCYTTMPIISQLITGNPSFT